MSCGCNNVQAGGKRHGRKKRGGFDLTSWLSSGNSSSSGQSQPSMPSQSSGFFSNIGQSFKNLTNTAGEQYNRYTRKNNGDSSQLGYITPSQSLYRGGGRSRGGRRNRGGRRSRGGKKSRGGRSTKKNRKH